MRFVKRNLQNIEKVDIIRRPYASLSKLLSACCVSTPMDVRSAWMADTRCTCCLTLPARCSARLPVTSAPVGSRSCSPAKAHDIISVWYSDTSDKARMDVEHGGTPRSEWQRVYVDKKMGVWLRYNGAYEMIRIQRHNGQ